MAEKKFKPIGTCAFCGQTKVIETIGVVSQAELDRMATETCLCKEAQADKIKKARKIKISNFINKKFPEEKLAKEIIKLTELVEDATFEEVQLKLYRDKVIKIWKDADSNINIRVKRTENDELKA